MWRSVLRDLGLILHVPGVMAAVSLGLAIVTGETGAAAAFLATIVASVLVGQLLFRPCRRAEESRLRDAMVTAALAWAAVPVLGAIPFLWTAWSAAAPSPTLIAFRDPLNALFEAVSGFTSTGLTVAVHPAELPRSLQWWRSFTQWVGGVGVIVLVLSVLGSTAGAHRLYYSEARDEKILPSVTSTVRRIWWIYVVFTAVSVLLLLLATGDGWVALNHGMTAIATGGFTVTNESLTGASSATKLVLLPVLVAGAISFVTHEQMLRQGRAEALWRPSQQRTLWTLLAAGGLLMTAENFWSHGWNVDPLDSVFQWVSALATAGFQTVDLRSWTPTAHLLLAAGMTIGGAAGSTAGGLKLARVVWLSKEFVWSFQRISLTPHQIPRYSVDGEGIPRDETDRRVAGAAGLAVLWLGSLWAGTAILLHVMPGGFTASEVILEAASAQSNVGLSSGLTGADLHWVGRTTLIGLMWVGRLEIIPVVLLVMSLFGHSGASWRR